MLSDFDQRLRALAEVVVRIGVNLQPGQSLLLTDPYDLQGIHPEAGALAEAIRAAALEAVPPRRDHPPIEIRTATPANLRALAEANDTRAFDRLVAAHIRRLEEHRARGGAFLFLTGSEPRLFHGLPAGRLTQFDQIKWRHLGPLIQKLIRGAAQWTLIPAPTAAWADVAYADLPADQRLDALWRVVFESFRIERSSDPSGHKAPPTAQALEAWRAHLAGLASLRDGYNAARHRQLRYVGAGTDLTLELPRQHLWCTAQLVSKRGVPFVVNLPTEEIFTAPHQDSAEGRVRVARPVVHSGTVIDGIQLEFTGGRIVAAHADTGQDLMRHLLATDEGARRIGEVAIVPHSNVLSLAGRCFHNAILDENAVSHIALGEAYRFCSRAWLPWSINSSQIHVDLPLDARVELS